MDQDETDRCIAELRELANKIAGTTTGTFQDAIDMAEAFADLDASMRSGGVLPRAWTRDGAMRPLCGSRAGVFPERTCELPTGHAGRHLNGPLAWRRS